MLELVDSARSKRVDSDIVWVRVPLPLLIYEKHIQQIYTYIWKYD